MRGPPALLVQLTPRDQGKAWRCLAFAGFTRRPDRAHAAADPPRPVTFTIAVENVSGEDTLKLPDGGATRVPIAPGVFAVFRGTARCAILLC